MTSLSITYIITVDVKLNARTYSQKSYDIASRFFESKGFAVHSYAVVYFDGFLSVVRPEIFAVNSGIRRHVRTGIEVKHISGIDIKRLFVSLKLPASGDFNTVEFNRLGIKLERHIAYFLIKSKIPFSVENFEQRRLVSFVEVRSLIQRSSVFERNEIRPRGQSVVFVTIKIVEKIVGKIVNHIFLPKGFLLL